MVAEKIYYVTGNLGPRGYKEHRTGISGYNSPSGLSYVSKKLGLKVYVNAIGRGYEQLRKRYPNEENLCRRYAAVNTDAPYSCPSNAEIQLLCVSVDNSNNLHWIARSGNGQYYDPTDGSNDNVWGNPSLGQRLGSSCYVWTGLWITLKKTDS